MGTSRRTFLKVGGLSAFALAAGGALYRAMHTDTPHRYAFDGEARAALQAIAPAILAGALPQGAGREAALATTIEGVHSAILGLLRSAYHALHDLVLGAWYAQPASWLAAGYPGPMKALA
jgi:hypothetical protein